MTNAGPTATVTLIRTHDTDVRERQIYARIDDGPTRMLLFGDTATFDVTPGEHRLRANNTLFWKTVPFTVQPGEHVTFQLINRAIWTKLIGVGFFAGGMPLRLIIERKG
ncbi:MAG TPA: hypothetical protein VG736_04635 [Vicinamibacterales bacterium]|jgi:hypothetical protein|nr:hypothetical protein [Vicinamibacterales bacterium]